MVFHTVRFSALKCFIYILMTFVIYQTFRNLLHLQTIQILFSHNYTTSLCNTLNTELEKLNAWFNLNKLSLNLQQTNYITLFINNFYSTIQIAINGSNNEKVNSTKCLGVYIDHLNWKDHIAYIISKLSKCTAVIHQTGHVLDQGCPTF